MKQLLILSLICLRALATFANSIETPVNQSIPDGDLSGLASTINLSGLTDPIGNLQVELNISGTYNGDLYAYLTHGSGFVVLLNRVGATANDSLGYGDAGMNVTFSGNAPDIHDYRVTLFGNSSTALGGPLTGTWGPDGRAVSPGSVTDADPRTALLSSFQGLDPNGQWTLFVADVSGGDVHELKSWSLDLNAPATSVPDGENTLVLLALGLTAVRVAHRKRHFVRTRHGFSRLEKPANTRSPWTFGLFLFVLWCGQTVYGQGGRVTGFGSQVIFPLNGYGATVSKIAAAGDHNLAITRDSHVLAWGDNTSSQCALPKSLDSVVAVAPSDSASFAVKEDGTVAFWGSDDFTTPDILNQLHGIASLAVTVEHALALKSDGTVVASGHNETGQTDVPAGLAGVQAVAAGGNIEFHPHSQKFVYGHSVALKSDGTVVVWGNNSTGQRNVPAGLQNVTAVASGRLHILALKADGTVVAWGSNAEGHCDVPSDLSDAVAISAGAFHSLAVRRDGTVAAWGSDANGQCDVPDGLHNVVAVAAGAAHSLALKSNGEVVGWGQGANGQTTSPAGTSDIVSVAVGAFHSLGLTHDGTVRTWGLAQYGLPDGLSGVAAIAAGQTHSLALFQDGTVLAAGFYNGGGPPQIPSGLSDVVAVSGAVGGDFSLALKRDGTVVAWGVNYAHVLDVPPGLNEVVAISAGGDHSLALKADGTVVAWGDPQESSIPPGLNRVVSVAAGGTYSLALTQDGSVVAWGPAFSAETQLPAGLNNVIAISAGTSHALALKGDGTVIAWGAPVQTTVPGDVKGVDAIAAEGYSVVLLGWKNRSPVAGTFEATIGRNQDAFLSMFSLHGVCSDPDWDTFMVTDVSSTSAQGGTAGINGGYVRYSPPFGFVGTDSLTYTVRDNRGATSQGSIKITVTESSVPKIKIPDLYNTGVDNKGEVLTDGTVGDPHYALISVPSGTTTLLVRRASGGSPIPPYLGDNSLSAWIGPNNDSSLNGQFGTFDFRTTFDLSGIDPGTVAIYGRWATDNEGVDIRLNGVSIGNGANPDSLAFEYWTSFTVSSGFTAGVNTLDFIVNNDGGPTGLRVEIDSVPDLPPVAASYNLGTTKNQMGRLSLSKLERACTDPDGDTVSVAAINPLSSAGGHCQIDGDTILYSPPLDFIGADTFTYTVRDSRGATSTGNVRVAVNAPTDGGLNIVKVALTSGNTLTIHCAGIPGATYFLEASTDLLNWVTIGSTTVAPNGLFEINDPQAGNYPSRYYRTRYASAQAGDLVFPPTSSAGHDFNHSPVGQSFTSPGSRVRAGIYLADETSFTAWLATIYPGQIAPGSFPYTVAPSISVRIDLLDGEGTRGHVLHSTTRTLIAPFMDFVDVDYGAAGVLLTAGQKYTILLTDISVQTYPQGVTGWVVPNVTYSGGLPVLQGVMYFDNGQFGDNSFNVINEDSTTMLQ